MSQYQALKRVKRIIWSKEVAVVVGKEVVIVLDLNGWMVTIFRRSFTCFVLNYYKHDKEKREHTYFVV